MPITWTFMQLFLVLCVGFALLVVAFSRSNPVIEAFVLILAAHYLGINTLCWNAFLQTSVWRGGEEVFRFGISPFLPAASFYLGVFSTLAVVCAGFSVSRSAGRYSRRQRWAFLAACLILLMGLAVSLRTPIALQSWIDSNEVTKPSNAHSPP